MYKKLFKRLIDIIVSFIGLIISLPILLFVTVVLTVVNKGNPFFIQHRPGLNEKIFRIIKFKTMTDDRNNQGDLLPDEARMTKIGSFVRKTSIDELPQLVNVLKGDMSIIGPRPLLPKYLSLYNKIQKKRHNVRPGITGWAQVNGRNTISWDDKFSYDVWYVDNVSLKSDIKILLLTVRKVINAQGINAVDKITMEEFKGES